ncbi:unnamed protein product [Urochloa decumbens]|uniref:RING-type domain-containing protein n=1 Tax=Urochloa decumbens TaxID=240449 RepID=A0ABC9CTJ0_9POAL
MTPSAMTASNNDPCSDHSFELPLRRNLLLLLDLLDVLRFVAGVLLDRLGVVSCEGGGVELPGRTWGGGGGHADHDDAAAVAVERFLEATTRLGAPGAPRVTRAARYWRRRRRADGEGAASVCAICLAELAEAGDGEGGCQQTVAELGVCSHAFHAACIDAWAGAAEAATCPLCRAPMMLPAAWDDGRQSLCHARPGD